MSRAFADEQTIDAPVGTVWATLTDWGRAPAWMPGVDSMRAAGPLAEDTRLTFTARGKDRTSTVTECRPESTLTLTSTLGGVRANYRYLLAPKDPATTLASLTVDVETSGLMKLFGPMIRSAIAKADGVQLAQLKHLIEQPGG